MLYRVKLAWSDPACAVKNPASQGRGEGALTFANERGTHVASLMMDCGRIDGLMLSNAEMEHVCELSPLPTLTLQSWMVTSASLSLHFTYIPNKIENMVQVRIWLQVYKSSILQWFCLTSVGLPHRQTHR